MCSIDTRLLTKDHVSVIKQYFKKEINQIPDDLFEDVDELNDLDLSHMDIEELPTNLFHSIKTNMQR